MTPITSSAPPAIPSRAASPAPANQRDNASPPSPPSSDIATSMYALLTSSNHDDRQKTRWLLRAAEMQPELQKLTYGAGPHLQARSSVEVVGAPGRAGLGKGAG